MKKHILTTVCLLSLAVSTSAQDSYYYYDGGKIPLTEIQPSPMAHGMNAMGTDLLMLMKQ